MKIKNHIYKIILFICLLSSANVQARKIIDPTWQIMIDSSDVIAKIEFISNGTFEATAEILTIFKGETSTKEILIKGFSDKDIKVNYVKKGDQYMVFLKKNENDFSVWSPTSGYLKIDKKHIQYNLLQTTNYASQDAFSLKLFEKFITAAVSKEQDNSKFHQSMLKLIESKIYYPVCAQYILMLQMSGYKTYDNILLEIVFNKEPDTRIALARFLGEIGTVKARENLVTLLANKDIVVAEEAANQLIHYEPEYAGAALLRKFNSTGEPSTFLDLNGSISQFKLKLMKSMVQLGYKPAIEYIIPMLKTKNNYLFNLTLDAVSSLNGENYITYLDSHILQNDSALFPDIFKHIIDQKMKGGAELILNFINNTDKSDTIYSYLASSKGLEVYDNIFLTDSIIKNMGILVDSFSSKDSMSYNHWMKAYCGYLTKNADSLYRKSYQHLTYILTGLNFENDSIQGSDYIMPEGDYVDLGIQFNFEYSLIFGTKKDLLFLYNWKKVNLTTLQRSELDSIILTLEKRLNL